MSNSSARQVREEPHISGAMFEALFLRGMAVDAVLRERLFAAGVDLELIRAKYPAVLFRKCVELAAVYAIPNLPYDEAMRALGRTLVSGFLQTVAGRVIGLGLPFLGPARYLAEFPERATLENPDLRITGEPEGERRFRLRFEADETVSADFMAGVLEAGLRRTQTEPRIEIVRLGPGGFHLVIEW